MWGAVVRFGYVCVPVPVDGSVSGDSGCDVNSPAGSPSKPSSLPPGLCSLSPTKTDPQICDVASSSPVRPIRARRVVVDDSPTPISPSSPSNPFTNSLLDYLRKIAAQPMAPEAEFYFYRNVQNLIALEAIHRNATAYADKALQEHIALFQRRLSFDVSQEDPILAATIAPTLAPLDDEPPQPSNSFAGGDFGAQTRRRAHPNNVKKLKPCQIECSFCKNNQQEDWQDHATKDADMKTICPRLRDYVCPHCNATGDLAHTRRYCPAIYESNQRRLQRESERNRRVSQSSAGSSEPEHPRIPELFVIDNWQRV